MQEFSGLELAEEVAAETRQDLRGREIEWKIGAIPLLRGDRTMLKQVFANLLENAVKYSRGKTPARIEVFSRERAGETVIGVRDNGVGFNMRLYPGLFGVFRRLHADEEFEGTGIGLANVKSVVIKHGGRVWAESVPDTETTFYFSLPAAGR
jgi:light-regulated signal transduction histidine kinase (bacteriophytochrome)